MGYKSIVVHVDTSAQGRARVAVAMDLAKQFGAHLSAVYSVFEPDPQTFYVMAGTAQYFAVHEEERAVQAAAVKRNFDAELERMGIEGDWIETGTFEGTPVSRYGRCADLIVVGQVNPDDPDTYIGEHFVEDLIMSSGRPVLMIPYTDSLNTIGGEVMIAWDGSREASRAVADSMPFLKKAKHTSVVTLDQAAVSPFSDRIPGIDIAATIRRHDVNVDVCAVEGVPHARIGEALLSQASDLNAGLLVMGAYGHARWKEMVLGGATRTLLASATLPVLFSH